jgi:glycerol-3-phosphate dehydrogenase (NAD(P)+)
MPTRVAVVGGGSWGTAVASVVSRNASVVLWARRRDVADEVNRSHTNETYLPGFGLRRSLRATSSLEEGLTGAEVVVMGVPSHGFRGVLEDGVAHLGRGVPVVSLTKGLEQGSLKRMTEVVTEVAPGHPAAVLTGPNLAKEVMAGYPAASVVAVEDDGLATDLQHLFATDWLRVYTNPDVIGCEVAGALKNVMAIAAGMADGMGFGDNTKATLITRGLAELARLGVALGGDPLTFAGLAGMGDLVATCISRQSRNRHVGEELGRGRAIDDIVDEMDMVAEGVKTSKVVVDLARRTGVDMPIAEQVVAVVEGAPATDAVANLMQREAGGELEGIASRGGGRDTAGAGD